MHHYSLTSFNLRTTVLPGRLIKKTVQREAQLARMLIDGAWVDGSDDARDPILNPATGATIDTVPRGNAADAERAVAAAREGKRRIARLPAHERCAILLRVADRIEREQDELARLLCRENGKTLREIGGEIRAAIRIWRGYAEEAKRLFGRATPLDSVPGRESSLAITLREPLGIIVAIVPFNYPIELWSHKVAGGLAAGNAVITKPPEECPLTLLRVAEFIEEAGAPRAAHQVVTGLGEIVGAALVRAEAVRMVAMTGSTAVGKQIARSAADTLKKVHLELGGNDATIICADADPVTVASDLIAGRFTSGNGQICCAVKRVLVHESIYEAVVDAVVTKTKSLKIGDPLDASTDVGPLITEQAAARVEAQVSRSIQEGARALTGGRRQGNFYEPTVLVDLPPYATGLQEEVFGPVLPIVPFSDFDSALAVANEGPYGLQAAIYTHDIIRIMKAFRELDVGTVVVNHTTAVRVENLPFGGTKSSGNSREGLHETLLEMTEQKTLLMNGAFERAN
jgi:acyl-CoA reductase-like NAD-dependent aldehyde dehydrogenase